jgi:hypothetical protein
MLPILPSIFLPNAYIVTFSFAGPQDYRRPGRPNVTKKTRIITNHAPQNRPHYRLAPKGIRLNKSLLRMSWKCVILAIVGLLSVQVVLFIE